MNTTYILIGYYDKNDYINSEFYQYDTHREYDLLHPEVLRRELKPLVLYYSNPYWPILAFGTCHSDLFNFFGHYIAKGILKPEDVKVYLFDESHNRKECSYDKEGFLINWHFGFFEPQID